MPPEFILLSGIPASGKSTFASWLQDNHGYRHLDVEKAGALAAAGLVSAWEELTGELNPVYLINKLRESKSPVVLEWGFPAPYLRAVAVLKFCGVSICWFDADRTGARQHFIARGDVPIERFDRQMAIIELVWPEIEAVFSPNIVCALAATGQHTPADEIAARLGILKK